MTHKVAVIGGGFAGWRAVGALARSGLSVTLFDPRQTLVMLPALPDIAGGWVRPQVASTPLAAILPRNIAHEWCRVESIDLERRSVTAGGTIRFFDAIVITVGACAAPFSHAAMSRAHTLDSLESALRLRDEFAAYLSGAGLRHLVIAGGGYTGLELAAALAARARAAERECRVTVVERDGEILSFLPRVRLRKVRAALADAGVEVLTGAHVESHHGDDATINGQLHEDVFFCWTVGSVFPDIALDGTVARLPDGRLKVEDDLSLAGYPEVFAAGDAAAVCSAGRPLRKAVNFAWHGGRLAGLNAAARLRGRPTRPYRPADLGWAIPLHVTGIGQAGGRFWFGGRAALRVHYLMCAVRSPRLAQKAGFMLIALGLFKTKRRKEMKGVFFGGTADANPGLLLLRLFAGAAMLTHGIPKLFGGLTGFTQFVVKLNLPFPHFLALMAALSESLGALLLALGLCTRLAAALLVATMSVAAFIAQGGKPFAERELALFYLCTALLFLLKGAGKWSLDAFIRR